MGIQKSKEEMRSIVEDWKRSGLSKKKFCELEGIATGTFYYWLKCCSTPMKKEEDLSGFQEVIPEVGMDVEVCYPNGVVIRLPKDSPLSKLGQLISLV